MRMATLWMVAFVGAIGTMPTGMNAGEPTGKKDGVGTQWELSPTTPRFGSVLLRFEDPAGKLWPTYVMGRGAGKSLITMVSAGSGQLAPQGTFHLKGESVADIYSVRHPRTLEQLLKGKELPKIELTIEQIDKTPKRIVEYYERRGKKAERTVIRFSAKGRLTVGENIVPVTGLLKYRLRLTNRKPYLGLGFATTIDGTKIGLTPGEVKVHVEALAAPPGTGVKKRK